MKNPIVRAASSIQLQSRRRSFIQAAAATAASVIVPSTWAQPAPRFAASPVALGVIDVAGNLALTQKIFDNYAVAHKDRSEEHTSELQSLMRISYAVFCLKKKKNTKQK